MLNMVKCINATGLQYTLTQLCCINALCNWIFEKMYGYIRPVIRPH